MKGVRLEIKGEWAQFRRAETNNNPLSHDFITKTALIGMIGAVLGIDRDTMKAQFPILSEDIKYGVHIRNNVTKQSWGFTLRSAGHAWEKSPKQMEFIRNPHYEVIIGLQNNRSEKIFDCFVEACRNGQACYEPVLGLHNCPAEIFFIEEGNIDHIPQGTFSTQGFVTNKHQLNNFDGMSFRLGFDKVSTFQNDNFWNLPESFVAVIYPSGGNELIISGEYYTFNNQSQWCLI
jgi:CRISPR-associated protein Cas5 subtype I-B